MSTQEQGAHSIAEALAQQFSRRVELNEATTRRDIISRILHEVLLWPPSAVRIEKNSPSGFVDYLLLSRTEQPVLVLEAKRSGEYFVLPRHLSKRKSEPLRTLLRTLLTHRPIKKAVEQAKNYATGTGCTFAGITNGFEWIFFRTFVRGRKYDDLDALVIPSLAAFSTAFTEVTNLLGYEAIVVDNELTNALPVFPASQLEAFYPKRQIISYDAMVGANEYARYLEPIARQILRDIPKDDPEFMEACYVIPAGQSEVEYALRKFIQDSVTPYLENDGVYEIGDTTIGGGHLAKRIKRNIKNLAGSEVIILFGGKGAGKSTFVERLLYHNISREIAKTCLPIVLDMIACPQTIPELTTSVWQRLVSHFDIDNTLVGDIETVLELFADSFDLASRQTLFGMESKSAEYIRTRNQLVEEWKRDSKLCARSLRKYWAKRSRLPIIVLDNTDQLPGHLQDSCFLTAHEISRELDCLVIISMREERYCRAKASGALDAFHNNGYHLPAPAAEKVFIRRIKFILKRLEDIANYNHNLGIPNNAPQEDLRRFFHICLADFANPNGNLNKFLERCSQNNLRLALDFFRSFISSGYTNVSEMISTKDSTWKLLPHQVIRPMMIPTRHNYDEDKSQVPNAYQLRCQPPGRSSHFTMLRLLAELRRYFMPSDKRQFRPVHELLAEFDDHFGMREDCELAIDRMLRYRLVEADNRMETYKERVGETDNLIYADSVRITPYGVYLLEELSVGFTYLDLVSLDTGIRDASICNEFCHLASCERTLAYNQERLKRLESRLDRVDKFLLYLKSEEDREQEIYSMPASSYGIVDRIRSNFVVEKPQILQSATKRFDH